MASKQARASNQATKPPIIASKQASKQGQARASKGKQSISKQSTTMSNPIPVQFI
jgi:hypothetical protein